MACLSANLLCYIIVVFSGVNSVRILGIFHVPSHSHYSLASTLMKELAEKGHNVTLISPYSQSSSENNLTQIQLTGFSEKIFAQIETNYYEKTEIDSFSGEIRINNLALLMTEMVFEDENVRKLLKSNEQFDLIILEEFMSYALKGIAYHFKAPCIMFTAIGQSRWINTQIGNPSLPSYIVDPTLPYISKMNFLERFHNFLQYSFGELYKRYWIIPKHNAILHKYLPKVPNIEEIFDNTSLALVNADISTHEAIASVPNMINIGGFHIQPSNNLKKDLREFLDGAEDGFIYFSMGSILKSKEMSSEKRNAILNAFARLKQRVIWKWESEDIDGKPENVQICKWLPQTEILAHPNIKLFITHGGLLSTIEAVYHGVPILGIPIYGDQRRNLAYTLNKGFGLQVPYLKLTEETFLSSLREILHNEKYQENAKMYSKIMHDQPIKPLDKAIFWIEYVIRHKGAPHLRTAAVDLKWYQYFMCDVIFVILVIIFLTCSTAYIIVRAIIRKFWSIIGSNKRKTE